MVVNVSSMSERTYATSTAENNAIVETCSSGWLS